MGRLLKVSCVIAWIITMALLLEKEGLLRRSHNITYYDLFSKKDPYKEEYLGIYLGKQKIGFSKSYMDTDFIENKVSFRISNETGLFVKAFNQPTSIHITTEIIIDDKYRLKTFSSSLSGDQYKITANGKKKGGKIIVSLYSADHLIGKRVYSEKDFVFTEGFIPLSTLPSFSSGKVYYLTTLDPFGIIGEGRIKMEIFKKTTIMHEDELCEVYPIGLTYQGIKAHVYVIPNGKILRAELPFGLVAKAEDKKRPIGIKFSSADILTFASIPSNMIIKEPRDVTYLKIKMDDKIKTIKKETLEYEPYLLPIEKYEAYIKETPFVQSHNKQIKDTAAIITKGEKDSLKASQEIMKWVYENIEQKPIFSLPSAIEVLKYKKGDCNEHTILFTALTRSLGIPTKMITGLCYANGRFYYHSWASVFCGKWISIDPTFNQMPPDATHIPLLEGDIEKQIGLLKDVKIEVLDYGYN